MSEVGANIVAAIPADRPPAPPVRVRPRSMTAIVVREVIGKWGARIGLAWVGMLVVLAVLAPVLASSYPYLMRSRDGSLSSPWLAYLTRADWRLFGFAVVAALTIVFTRKRSAAKRCLIVGIGVLVVWCGAMFIKERSGIPQIYRTQQQAGEIAWAVRAPIAYSPDDHQDDAVDVRLKAPSAAHWFGTTGTGADLAANMIYATRVALTIGFISTAIAVSLGVAVGGTMGYFGGWVDLIGMRLVEIVNAVPTLLLMLCLISSVKDPNIYMLMVVIGLTSWNGYAEFTRAEYLSLRQRDFVQAALAAGIPLRSILFRHMLPNGMTSVLISASFGVASAILAESTLSFLGIQLGVGEASWGKLLSDARSSGGTFYWWLALAPGFAIFLTVFAYNLTGEAMRDALDPKLLKRE